MTSPRHHQHHPPITLPQPLDPTTTRQYHRPARLVTGPGAVRSTQLTH